MISKRILDIIVDDIKKYYLETKRSGFNDVKIVNRLKLLLSLLALLPLEDYNYVINNLPQEIREILARNHGS
jgi:hypothetical protein